MRIDFEEANPTTLKTLVMTHEGESLTWNVFEYNRSKFVQLPKLFDEINAYWFRMAKPDQDALWSLYKEIHHQLRMMSDTERQRSNLSSLVCQIYDIMPFESVRQWANLYGNLPVPPSVKKMYEEGDQIPMTYLKNDYYDLAIFTIALKAVVPIFAEYLSFTKGHSGTNYKELVCLGLLSHSTLVNTPPWLRLREYIEACIAAIPPLSESAIVGGLGTAELPDWLLSRAVVRRVCIGEAGVADENNKIISNVFHTVRANMRSMDRNFEGKLNPKRKPSDTNEEDNVSFAENYKVKEPIPGGDLAIPSVYTEDPHEMARRVDPTIDEAILEECLRVAREHPAMNLTLHHEVFIQWVLSVALPMDAIPSLENPELMNALPVTQALLWHWGFLDLAVLCMGEKIIPEDNGLLRGIDAPGKLPRDLQQQLLDLYPHHQRAGGKSKSPASTNVGCIAIELLTDVLGQYDWRVLGPDLLIKQAGNVSGDSTMIMPVDIRAQLAKLMLHLAPSSTTL